MHHPRDVITHTTAFVTPVVEQWLEREIAQLVHHEGSIRQPTVRANALTTVLHLAPASYFHPAQHFQAIIMHYYFNTRSEVDPGQGCIHSTYHLYVSHSNHWTTELVIQVQSGMQLLMRDYPIQNHHSLNTDAHFLSSPPPSVGLSHNTSEVSVTWCSYFLTADSDSHCCGKTIYWLQNNHSKISEKTTSSFLPLQVAIMLF